MITLPVAFLLLIYESIKPGKAGFDSRHGEELKHSMFLIVIETNDCKLRVEYVVVSRHVIRFNRLES